MSKRKKLSHVFFLCLTMLLTSVLLSGCMLKSVDELYTLPRQSDAYYNLQTEIEKVVTGTIDYSAPLSGENLQPLQMQDLDGDGVHEAIVFARDSSEKPLKMYIFSRSGDRFQLASTIEGVGAAFDSVAYAQVDGSPGKEILLGRSVGEQVLKALSVYSFQGNSTVELMSVNYSLYTHYDMDSDGRQDLFVIRTEMDTQSHAVELYRYNNGVMIRDPELLLSNGVSSVRRLVTGYASKDVPAVFVAGMMDENLIRTDVFCIRDGTMQNIVSSKEGENLTVRNYYVYSTDIDDDGLIELPEVSTLPRSHQSTEDVAYRLIHWYNLDLDGRKTYKKLTYHDYSQGFFVELDHEWKGNVTITRDDSIEEGIAYRFGHWKGPNKPDEEIFTIYLLSGDHRTELAEQDNRFLLADKNDVSFACSIGDSDWSLGLTEESLRKAFRFITMDWNSGEM